MSFIGSCTSFIGRSIVTSLDDIKGVYDISLSSSSLDNPPGDIILIKDNPFPISVF